MPESTIEVELVEDDELEDVRAVDSDDDEPEDDERAVSLALRPESRTPPSAEGDAPTFLLDDESDALSVDVDTFSL